MLSTSVKLVSAGNWFSSFCLGKKKQCHSAVRALLHHLVGRLDFLQQTTMNLDFNPSLDKLP